jgi:hypothetical protein
MDGFDFAAIFFVFATALAMTCNNPQEERRCAPYTTLDGSAQGAKAGFTDTNATYEAT